MLKEGLTTLASSAVTTAALYFLLKTWINTKIQQSMEQLRFRYSIELEAIKALDSRHLEDYKMRLSAYTALCSVLLKLQRSADTLWHKVNKQNIESFAEKLEVAKDVIDDHSIFIQKYSDKLKSAIHHFELFGKNKAEIYYHRARRITDQEREGIQHLVENNQRLKDKFDDLIRSITESISSTLTSESGSEENTIADD